MRSFPERADIRVVVHHRPHARDRLEPARQIEIAPAAHVRRERNPLLAEDHRSAESDAAALEPILVAPLGGCASKLFQHPVTAARAIGLLRLPGDHAVVFEYGDAELRAADVDGEGGHEKCPAAARISSGEAVPVPRFMMVMDAARLPNRAASTASAPAASATVIPAEKLSPAPQMSTGSRNARRWDVGDSVASDHQSALRSKRDEHGTASNDRAQRLIIIGAQPRTAARLARFVFVRLGNHVAIQLDALARIHQHRPGGMAAGEVADMAAECGRDHASRGRLGLIGNDERVEGGGLAQEDLAEFAIELGGKRLGADEVHTRPVFLAAVAVDQLGIGEGRDAGRSNQQAGADAPRRERADQLVAAAIVAGNAEHGHFSDAQRGQIIRNRTRGAGGYFGDLQRRCAEFPFRVTARRLKGRKCTSGPDTHRRQPAAGGAGSPPGWHQRSLRWSSRARRSAGRVAR